MIFWCIVIAIIGWIILTFIHWNRMARLEDKLNLLSQTNKELINLNMLLQKEILKYNPKFNYFEYMIDKIKE